MKSEEKVAQALIQHHLTLAIAESCTGGLIAASLTNIPGSSHFLKCGVITYSNESKTRLLNIPETLLAKKGAVSEDVALTMAKNVRQLSDTDFGISTTGIAGPDGGTKAKPVGLVYIALATKNEALCLKCQFPGDRASVRKQAVRQALELVLEFIEC